MKQPVKAVRAYASVTKRGRIRHVSLNRMETRFYCDERQGERVIPVHIVPLEEGK